jgi:hypothetical protein
MPELLRKQVWGSLSRVRSSAWPRVLLPRVSQRVWPMACAVTLAVLPPLARAADPLPASVRACAAVPDVLQRLSCYDREVARYPAPQAKSTTTGAPAASLPQTPAPAPQAAAKPVPPPVVPSSNTAGSSAPPAADVAATDSTKHFVAHLVSIERLPNEMILHLDNGQVWQEVQGVSGDLSLREGDAVTIDRHFGSYWLTGPHVSSMKVRLKS